MGRSHTAIPGAALTCKRKVLEKRDEGAEKFADCATLVEK